MLLIFGMNYLSRTLFFEKLQPKITLGISAGQLRVYPLLEDLSFRGNVKVMRGNDIDIIRKDELLSGVKVIPPAGR